METFLIKNGLRKSQAKRWFGFCAALGLMLVGSLACGPVFNWRRVPPPPYDAAFGSSGDCQSTTLDRAATSEVLTMVVSNGPNITLCNLNPLNGLLRGHTDLSLHGSPIGYADGLLYVNERGGSDGHSLALCAVDISHGQVRWCQSQIQGALQGVFEPSHFSPILGANGIIYMSIFFQIISPIKHINTPTALASAATVTPEPLAPTSPVATASLTDPRPYSVLYAFNEANGRIVWQYSLGHLYVEDPTHPLPLKLSQGMLYTEVQGRDGNNRICAVRARDGKQIWCQAFAYSILDGIALGHGMLYARTSTDVYALDATNGAQRWSVSLGPTGSNIPLLEVAGNKVYVNRRRCDCNYPSSDAADYLFAFNASNGTKLWTTIIAQSIWTLLPTATDGVIYAGSQLGGGVTAVRESDGALLWHQLLPSANIACCNVTDTVVSGNQAIFVSITNGAYDSDLVAVNKLTGSMIWQDDGCDKPGDATLSSPCYWNAGFPEPAITVLLPNN